jgi:hypothetical protein
MPRDPDAADDAERLTINPIRSTGHPSASFGALPAQPGGQRATAIHGGAKQPQKTKGKHDWQPRRRSGPWARFSAQPWYARAAAVLLVLSIFVAIAAGVVLSMRSRSSAGSTDASAGCTGAGCSPTAPDFKGTNGEGSTTNASVPSTQAGNSTATQSGTPAVGGGDVAVPRPRLRSPPRPPPHPPPQGRARRALQRLRSALQRLPH